MRKYFTLIIFNIFVFLPMTAQEHSLLSLEDLIPGGKTYRKYQPTYLNNIAWYNNELTYHRADTIYIVDKQNPKKKKNHLLTLGDINTLLDTQEQIKSLNHVSFSKTKNLLEVYTPNTLTIIDVKNKKKLATFSVQAKMENLDFNDENLELAYTIDNNLYIQDKTGKETAISDESNKRIIYGKSVHQNEFGINKGTFWSPKGNRLAFYKMDESMVGVYPLVDTSTRMATLKERVYPMAGEKSHHVKVGIYDVNNQDTIFLKTGLPKEKYLTNIAWSPDEKYVFVAELNRGQDTLNLVQYDAIKGNKIKTLFTEINDKYVEPENPILFISDNEFIWQSKKDGYNHLYLYNTNGEELKQITSGNFDVSAVLAVDKKNRTIFYTSNELSPIEQHVFEIHIDGENKSCLNKDEGIHSGNFSNDTRYYIDFHTSQNNPGTTSIVDTKTKKNATWHQAKNPFDGIKLPEVEIGSITAADGKTPLYYKLVKPLNFDANKKYPVIVYVYGGPHSQLVTNSWSTAKKGWDIYMAQKGYIVFTLDNRGTQNRGLAFENVTHGLLGVEETKDQMEGVKFLSQLPYVDSNRIGVHGWSFGGFMTLNMMLRHPETFKVGVAGGPVVDWKYYEIMYGERYMQQPQKNTDGYNETNMTNHIGNLQGRLLLIYGDEDPVVLPQHTSALLRASVKEGVHPDLFVYPGHKHNVLGKDRVHLHEQITRYFDDFLK